MPSPDDADDRSQPGDEGSSPLERANDLRRNVIHSTIWITIGFGATQVIKVISSIVLTRLIHPEIFGLMDVAVTFMVGLALFSDLGLGPSVIQNPRGEAPAFLNTAWTLQVLRGGLLCVGSCAIAWPVAVIYDRPILASLLIALASTALIDGFVSPGFMVLARRVRRGPLVLAEIITAVTSLIVTVATVYILDPTGFRLVLQGTIPNLPFAESVVWAVVAGSIVSRLVYLLLSLAIFGPERPKFTWDRGAVREILSFGKWIFVSTAFTFVAMHTDRLLVPKLIDFEAGGLYGRALALVVVATGTTATFSRGVLFPYCSRALERGEAARSVSARVYLPAGLLSSLALSGLIACGPAFTRIMYAESYAEVAWIVQLAALVGWLQTQGDTASSILLGFNQRPSMVVPMIAKFVALVLAIQPSIAVAAWAGWNPLTGLILCFAVAELTRYAVIVAFCFRMRLVTWQLDLALGPAMVAVGALGFLAGAWLHNLVVGAAPVARLEWLVMLVFQALIVVGLWGMAALVLRKLGHLRLG